MTEPHFKPEGYLELMHDELPRYDELQERTAEATVGVDARRILELGIGTGETARRLLAHHPNAHIVGIDASREMLEEARTRLPTAELQVQRLQEPLPAGPFDLVVSALAVHHLAAGEKRSLFRRVRQVLASDGLFVLADVVVPEEPGDAVTPIDEGFDLPERLECLLEWLEDAGFEPAVYWRWKDVAVVRAGLRRT